MAYQQMLEYIIGEASIVSNKTIMRIADGAVIPFDPANTDYQQYLAWLAEGGVPTPADENA